MERISQELTDITTHKVGKVLNEGLACLYATKPEYPVSFLANWLLNYSATQRNHGLEEEAEKEKQRILKKQEEAHQKELEAEKKKAELKAAQDSWEAKFRKKIEDHLYHKEMVGQEFPDFLKERMGLPAVYIGQLTYPVKEITDADEEPNAHLDTAQEMIITYVGANKEQQKHVLGKNLLSGEGVTLSVLKPKEEEDQGQQPNEEGEEESAPKAPKTNYLYVADVTKESRMSYFRIPRLGAYIACPMVYKSVLSEIAFDEGLKERQRVLAARAEQQKQKDEKDAEFQQKIDEAQDQGIDTKELEAEWANIKWEEIAEPDFINVVKSHVLCADTLGEDREISEEQRNYLEESAKFFANCWQESERKQLSNDIDRQLKYLSEFNKEEYLKELNDRMNEEHEERVKQYTSEEGGQSELKTNYAQAAARADFYADFLQEDDTKELIMRLKDYRVVKFTGLFQIAFFLAGYTKQEINLPNTNILDWKRAKTYVHGNKGGFFQKLKAYGFKGPKTVKPKPYARPDQILKKLETINLEEVENYNMGLAILYKFIKHVLEARNLDVEVRKADKAHQKEVRKQRIQESETQLATKEQALEHAKTQVQEGEEFDQEEWVKEWIENNPPIEIPEEVVDDVDADVEQEAPQEAN